MHSTNTTELGSTLRFAKAGAAPMNNQSPILIIHQDWPIGGFFSIAKPMSRMKMSEIP